MWRTTTIKSLGCPFVEASTTCEPTKGNHEKSSNARYTSSLVIGFALGSMGKNGISPLFLPVFTPPLNPRRANSDTALPRLIFFRCANARATDSTSSSMFSVVRTKALSFHSIKPSMSLYTPP